MNTISPWLTSAWEQLVHYKNSERLPNALLITGVEGIGKSTFAQQFARFILCQTTYQQNCDCRSCQLFLAGNHPDYMLLQPEEESSIIKIDQVRKTVQFLNQTRSCSQFQVVVINPAEALNRAAANSLLKTLEEPRGSVLIMLVSHNASSLPATIRSRCHQIKLAVPSEQQSLQWLKTKMDTPQAELFLRMADYLPLKALNYAQSNITEQRQHLFQQLLLLACQKAEPLQVASQFLATNLAELLILMSLLVTDLIKIKMQITAEHINNQDKLVELQEMSRQLTLKHLYNYLDKLTEATRLIANHTNINSQLLLEQLMIYWCYKNDFN